MGESVAAVFYFNMLGRGQVVRHWVLVPGFRRFESCRPSQIIEKGPLAQLVEHLTFNQGVGGSTPPWLTNSAGWSSLVARQAHNLKVGGSNPPPATIVLYYVGIYWIAKNAIIVDTN